MSPTLPPVPPPEEPQADPGAGLGAPPAFTPDELARLAAFADALLPAEDELPSATQADPSQRFLTRAIALVPHQAALVAAWLATADASDPEAELRRLELEAPFTFEALANVVFGAHLANRKIWKRIGYPGRRPRPPYADEADSFLEDGILDAVVERGPFLRQIQS